MDKLAAMQAFVEVARQGSFSLAARTLKISPSAVTKAVGRLEAELDTQLLNRTTHGVALTDEGRYFVGECEGMLASLANAEEQLQSRRISPQGVLRLGSLSAIARVHIVPRLTQFFEKYPDVRLELVLSEQPVDLVEHQLDVALRIGSPPDARVTARKLADTARITVASPAYIERFGAPATPAGLAGHHGLVHVFAGRRAMWRFEVDGSPVNLMPQSRLEVVNSGDALCAAAVAGLGIAHSNSLLFEHELARGNLVELLVPYQTAGQPLYAVYSPSRSRSPRVKVLVDSLEQLFSAYDRGAPGV
ncbi:MAG: LysR substrate-binding domain-containing protein [Pseudomonadota bacterium]